MDKYFGIALAAAAWVIAAVCIGVLMTGCSTIVPQDSTDAVLRIVDVIIYRSQ